MLNVYLGQIALELSRQLRFIFHLRDRSARLLVGGPDVRQSYTTLGSTL